MAARRAVETVRDSARTPPPPAARAVPLPEQARGGFMSPTPPKKSDLPARTASAVMMIAVAGTALWLGGWVWTAFVALVALGVLWEWWGLVRGISPNTARRAFLVLAGLGYVGIAGWVLNLLRNAERFQPHSVIFVGTFVLPVIATDIGAYFAGRTFGGPKIAPRISPSKTWSGLAGGMVGAGIAVCACAVLFAISGGCKVWDAPQPSRLECALSPLTRDGLAFFAVGMVIAVIAQSGDFLESWMKRKAGVKDSGSLIPGHGGLFDRVDGLLAVLFVLGLLMLAFQK